MQYRLRTLLIVLAIGPPLLAGAWIIRDILNDIVPRILYPVFVAAITTISVLLAVFLGTTVGSIIVERRRLPCVPFHRD